MGKERKIAIIQSKYTKNIKEYTLYHRGKTLQVSVSTIGLTGHQV